MTLMRVPPRCVAEPGRAAAPTLRMQSTTSMKRWRDAAPPSHVLRLAGLPILLVLTTIVLGALVGLIYSDDQPRLYEARSTIVVSPGTKFLDPQDADSFPRIATTVEEIALTQVVLQDAGKRLRARGFAVPSLDWLRDHLRLSISGDTPVLSLAAVAPDARLAGLISSAETEALTAAITAASANRPRGLTLSVFSKGELRGKVQPKPVRNALLGGNAGLLVGCCLVAILLWRPRTS